MSENLSTKEVPGGIEQYQRALEYERAERQRTVDQWLEERREKDARIADLTAEVAELRRVLQVALRAPGIHTTDQVTGEVFSAVIGTALGEQP